jgi:hypothetical protein
VVAQPVMINAQAAMPIVSAMNATRRSMLLIILSVQTESINVDC